VGFPTSQEIQRKKKVRDSSPLLLYIMSPSSKQKNWGGGEKERIFNTVQFNASIQGENMEFKTEWKKRFIQ